MQNEDMLSADDNAPATKGYIRDALKNFATKDDLKELATRSELAETNAVMRRMAIAIINIEASMRGMRDDFSTSMTAMNSRLSTQMDAFMAATLRVDHDNILLSHRVGSLEGRMSKIERPAS